MPDRFDVYKCDACHAIVTDRYAHTVAFHSPTPYARMPIIDYVRVEDEVIMPRPDSDDPEPVTERPCFSLAVSPFHRWYLLPDGCWKWGNLIRFRWLCFNIEVLWWWGDA